MRASPQHSTASAVVGQVGLEPGEAALGDRRTADVGDRELVPGLTRARLRASAVGPSYAGSRNANVSVGIGDRVQVGQHLHGRVLEPSLILGARVEEPVVAEVVGQHVARDEPVDAVHQEERGAEHRRRWAPSTAPAGRARRWSPPRSGWRRTGPGGRSARRPAGPRAPAPRGRRTARAAVARPRSTSRRAGRSPRRARSPAPSCAARRSGLRLTGRTVASQSVSRARTTLGVPARALQGHVGGWRWPGPCVSMSRTRSRCQPSGPPEAQVVGMSAPPSTVSRRPICTNVACGTRRPAISAWPIRKEVELLDFAPTAA